MINSSWPLVALDFLITFGGLAYWGFRSWQRNCPSGYLGGRRQGWPSRMQWIVGLILWIVGAYAYGWGSFVWTAVGILILWDAPMGHALGGCPLCQGSQPPPHSKSSGRSSPAG